MTYALPASVLVMGGFALLITHLLLGLLDRLQQRADTHAEHLAAAVADAITSAITQISHVTAQSVNDAIRNQVPAVEIRKETSSNAVESGPVPWFLGGDYTGIDPTDDLFPDPLTNDPATRAVGVDIGFNPVSAAQSDPRSAIHAPMLAGEMWEDEQ